MAVVRSHQCQFSGHRTRRWQHPSGKGRVVANETLRRILSGIQLNANSRLPIESESVATDSVRRLATERTAGQENRACRQGVGPSFLARSSPTHPEVTISPDKWQIGLQLLPALEYVSEGCTTDATDTDCNACRSLWCKQGQVHSMLADNRSFPASILSPPGLDGRDRRIDIAEHQSERRGVSGEMARFEGGHKL